jgi:hypothetical protein
MLRLIKANQAPEKQPIFLFVVLCVVVSCFLSIVYFVMAHYEFPLCDSKDHELITVTRVRIKSLSSWNIQLAITLVLVKGQRRQVLDLIITTVCTECHRHLG